MREIARLARLFEMGVGFKGGYSDFAEKILSKIESRGSERTSPPVARSMSESESVSMTAPNETDMRRDEILRRMLNTPPKPKPSKKADGAEDKKGATQRPSCKPSDGEAKA